MKLLKETSSSRRHGKWYDDACGMAFALELVGERWSLLIVRELMFGGRRFSDLRAGMPGISAKVLTERLETLERGKIIQRRKLPPPATVQLYELTPWGYQSEEAIKLLCRWAVMSSDHDPSLWLSPASLMLSLRTMFDASRAAGITTRGATRVGNDGFITEVVDGKLHIERGEPEAPDFVFETPTSNPIVYGAYGKWPLEDLAPMGLVVTGDRDAAQRFFDCFQLPERFS